MSDTKKSIYTAILEVQKKVSVLKKDADNPFFKSQYLSLTGLIEALQPVATENNLVIMQHPEDVGSVRTVLTYAPTGDTIESTVRVPVDQTKLTPQTAGSAISYARRYALMSIFNIATEDDDGNQSSVSPAKPNKCVKCKTVDAYNGYDKCTKCYWQDNPKQ